MDRSEIRDELIILCNLALKMLEKAKYTGLLTEDEYHEHIRHKIRFLESNTNIYSKNCK